MSDYRYDRTINWVYSQVPDKNYEGAEWTEEGRDRWVLNYLSAWKHFAAFEEMLVRLEEKAAA